MFGKPQYQQAKKFLVDHKAVIIKKFSTPTFCSTLFELDNREQWEENESRLEYPEDDYSLQEVVQS